MPNISEKNEKENPNRPPRRLSFTGTEQKRPDASVKDRGDKQRNMGEKVHKKQKLDINRV